jgi:DNA polymerase-3 subunit gamma/tau
VDEKARQQAVVIEEKKAELQESQSGPVEILTQEFFDQILPKILENFKSQNRGMELAILNQPIKVLGNEICLEITGHVQEEIALKMKPDLLSMIRDYTGIKRVLLRLEVKEEIETGKNKLYTSSDKFNFLKERHAALGEFQRRFGLETDF